MVAVVTGGSVGIGFAIAQALLAQGFQVVIGARRKAPLDAAVQRLGAGDKVHAVVADVREASDAERLIGAAKERYGGVDVLVNNAGVGLFAKVADMTLDEWHQVMRTNLDGVFYCTRAALPEMRQRGGGFIINISSLAGKNAFAGGAAYCASKAALNQFSEALMQEVRYDNIRVSYVLPGSVATAFGDPSAPSGAGPSTALGADWKLAPEDVARVVTDLIAHDARSLPSRVELRPSRPPRKG